VPYVAEVQASNSEPSELQLSLLYSAMLPVSRLKALPCNALCVGAIGMALAVLALWQGD